MSTSGRITYIFERKAEMPDRLIGEFESRSGRASRLRTLLAQKLGPTLRTTSALVPPGRKSASKLVGEVMTKGVWRPSADGKMGMHMGVLRVTRASVFGNSIAGVLQTHGYKISDGVMNDGEDFPLYDTPGKPLAPPLGAAKALMSETTVREHAARYGHYAALFDRRDSMKKFLSFIKNARHGEKTTAEYAHIDYVGFDIAIPLEAAVEITKTELAHVENELDVAGCDISSSSADEEYDPL